MMSTPRPTHATDPFGEIHSFLSHEARLLDRGLYKEWLDLFTEDGIYWIPSQRGQTDARRVPSIVYEDRHLLEMRIHRLAHPRAHAVLPAPRTLHAISNLDVIDRDEAKAQIRIASALLVAEYQDGRHRTFAAQCEHVLRRGNDGFKIASKRIDLIDCDGIHEDIVIIL